MSSRRLWVGGLCGAAVAAIGLWPGPLREVSGASFEPHRSQAVRALARARKSRKFGDRELAARAYLEVAEQFAELPEVTAEASFRAGEILRAAACEERAREAFLWARDRGGGEFALRAVLELAHLDRRSGSFESALVGYARVQESAGSARWVDEARYWAGRTCVELGRTREACGYLRRAAESAADPADRVRAYDAWMSVYLAEPDLEAAAGVLHAARQALASQCAERTEVGVRTRRAFDSMRSPARLVEALAERHMHAEGR